MGPTGPGGPHEGTRGIMPEGPLFLNVEIRDEGLREGRGGAWCRKQFEERMAESFPHLVKCIHLPSQDQQTKKSVLAHIGLKLLETEDGESALDVDRETSHIVSKEKKQPKDLDVPSETVEPRGDHASWSGVFGGLEDESPAVQVQRKQPSEPEEKEQRPPKGRQAGNLCANCTASCGPFVILT